MCEKIQKKPGENKKTSKKNLLLQLYCNDGIATEEAAKRYN